MRFVRLYILPYTTASLPRRHPGLLDRLDSDDVTERDAASTRLRKLAWHDPDVRRRLKEFIAETTSPEARGRAVSAMGRVRALAVPGDLVWLGWGVRRLDEDTVEFDGGQQASEGPSAAVRAVIVRFRSSCHVALFAT